MRFHIGFSKYIKLSFLLKWGLLILGFFGLNSCVAHAASFEIYQNWSSCPFGTTTYNNSNCSVYGSSVYQTQTLNGISNVLVPNGAYSGTTLRQNKMKTEIYKYGGTGDCSTGDTISFYVDAIMGGYNGSFADNVLDPNNFPSSPVVRGGNVKATCPNTWCDYWPWLSNTQSDSENKTGVKVSKSDGTSMNNCSFVSYGSNKSVRFRCSVASGTTGYQILLNEYNHGYIANTNLESSVGIKVSMINDPCVTQSNNNQGVIDSITDQTNAIVDELNGILDNQNANQSQTHHDLEGIQGKIDETNDKLDETNDKLEGINDSLSSCTSTEVTIDTSTVTRGGYLNSGGNFVADSNYAISQKFRLGSKTNKINLGSVPSGAKYYCYYDDLDNVVSCHQESTVNITLLNKNENITYVRYSFYRYNTTTYYKCDTIGNSILDNTMSNANINTSWMYYPTKIENIIYLPVSILRTIHEMTDQAVCTSPTINFTSIMDEWAPAGGLNQGYILSFPCMGTKIKDLLGTDIYNLIDYLLCAVLMYNFLVHLYKKFDSALSGSDHLIDDYYLQDTNMVGANLNYLSKRGGIDYD